MKLEQVADFLPESVKQIADLIGYPQTVRLLKTFGGTTFPMGRGARAFGAPRWVLLRELIGEKNAELIVNNFIGEVLYLPRCDRALRELRNRSFIDDYQQLQNQGSAPSTAVTLLCAKYGFSDRLAWRLLAEKKAVQDNQQKSLF